MAEPTNDEVIHAYIHALTIDDAAALGEAARPRLVRRLPAVG